MIRAGMPTAAGASRNIFATTAFDPTLAPSPTTMGLKLGSRTDDDAAPERRVAFALVPRGPA
jgi:hypothetical protein